MFILGILNFLIGHVTLFVTGQAVEKFINMAASRGFFLWDIKMLEENKIVLKVRLSAVKPLRHIARKTGCRFTIGKRSGLPFFLNRLSRRKALVAGCILCMMIIYVLSSFLWFIEVNGNQRVAKNDIIKAAAKAGLERGTLKKKVNIGAVEKSILEQLPAFSWVGIYIKGTRADIKVVEKSLAEEEESGFSHIVAAKAGLIENVLVLKGNPAVKEGDTVVPGQVLISGIIPPPEATQAEKGEKPKEPVPAQEPAYVNARGIVRARVWYEEYGEAQIVEKSQRPTGREVTKMNLKINGRQIAISNPSKVPFASYKEESFSKRIPAWRNITPDVEVIILKYYELQNYTDTRSKSQAYRLAKEKALGRMRQKFSKNAIILRERVEELAVSQPENVVRVRASSEVVEDIGVKEPFTVDKQ